MIKASQISKGMIILYNNEPCRVVGIHYTMSARGSNFISTKLKNILTGNQIENRFRTDEKIEKAFVETRQFEYLYEDGSERVFMDAETYEQLTLNEEDLGDVMGYILPNSVCQIQLYDGKAIGVEAPSTVQLKIVETEPVLKGATASGNVTKPATLETGIILPVPMFIETGEIIIVNTVTNEYAGRSGKQ